MGEMNKNKIKSYRKNVSIRIAFIFYALIFLISGIIVCVISISIIDNYRINLNYKYENMITRYDIPQNGSFEAHYNSDKTEYIVFDSKKNEVCRFNVDYTKERPVHEYIFPNHVSYIEVTPNFTKHDRIVDTALGVLNVITIPIILSISMIICVTVFFNKRLSKPIKLLTTAYSKVENNDLGFTLSYPQNDEMGKLCLAFEKMKECLVQNNKTMLRQFAEQRRLNAAFSHDLRTPLTLLKGHAFMLLSFIPKGMVSQEEIVDELTIISSNVSRLEKYVDAMTNLYRLEDIVIPKQKVSLHFLVKTLTEIAEMLCVNKKYTLKSDTEDETLFINLDTIIQIYENLLSNGIRYAKENINIEINVEDENLFILIKDDGEGFQPKDIEQATLPFYKASSNINDEHLGLGLNICKILCERHGGSIRIDNNIDGGACVTAWVNKNCIS